MTGEPLAHRVREIGMDRPWEWLRLGWSDMLAAPCVSLVYGAVFVVAGYLITLGLVTTGLFYLLLPVTAGFMLVGPLLAVGLYEISRRLQAGERTAVVDALGAWRANPAQLALMGFLLMLFMLLWVRVATLIFALFFNGIAPTLDNLVLRTLLSDVSLPFLFIGSAAGAVLAVLVFSISAVSVPMLLDRRVDVITAVLTSIAAVRANWKVMWGWACLIVLFAGAGLVTFYLGLAITLPLIGHASWHAYRDLVCEE